ncbi:hypothetical protein Ciccas_001899 [Cichlidogyrus casuarinus]|uniref:protein-serine/threonine phosphatase n=1 Tax=Cichlidogyrus casuarinus TaxID=1844966 RepID=A0ABD2QIQ9_9PLAT
MGAFLSTPRLRTDGDFNSNEYYSYASCSMQGWRKSQEDAEVCHPNLNEKNHAAFFAVFDGHGGSSVARYCAKHFPEHLEELSAFSSDKPELHEALKKLFLHIDEVLSKEEGRKELVELTDNELTDSEINETALEEREKEIDELCKESSEPLEQVVEKFGGEKALSEESRKLLEKRRKSSAAGECSKDDSEKDKSNGHSEKKEKNSKEEQDGAEEDEENDSDYDPSKDEDEDADEELDANTLSAFGKELAARFVEENIPGQTSGCTACSALFVPDLTTKNVRLFVANVGDSRAVLCRDGKAVDLSCDHKPESPEELARIKKAGGAVGVDGRVNGGLNLSRAIGDHTYKQREDLSLSQQMITADPDVTDTVLDPKQDQFLVIACDGVWNVMTSQEVVDFVLARLKDPDLVGMERKLYSQFKDEADSDAASSEDDDENEDEEQQGEDEEQGEDKESSNKESKSEDADGEEAEKSDNGIEKDEEEENGEVDDDNEDDEESDFEDEEVEHKEGAGLLKEIAKDLFHACISPTTAGDGTGCDNMTCIIIKFDNLEAYAAKAAIECGPVVETTLPTNDESEILERRKRIHSESDEEETLQGSGDKDQNEKPVTKKARVEENVIETNEVTKQNGVH